MMFILAFLSSSDILLNIFCVLQKIGHMVIKYVFIFGLTVSLRSILSLYAITNMTSLYCYSKLVRKINI